MAQPQAYNREVDFTERDGDDTNHAGINAELDAAALSINQIRDNLALIQRDDGALQNGIVTADSLAPSAFDAVLVKVNEAVQDAQTAAGSATLAATTAIDARDDAQAAQAAAETANNAALLNATTAATKAAEAAGSATSAATSASTATTKASEASTSATNAADSATAAAGSATTASTQATNAANSATAAATSATNAANSATTASTQAGIATTQASNAAASATAAAASFDDFEDRYLGPKSAAPTTDNDGNPLLTGALYFDTSASEMRVYTGTAWKAIGSAVNGTTNRATYTATAGQTTFAITYDVGFVDVYLNGLKLQATSEFTATNGTSIVLTTPATAGDVVDIVAYGVFSVADIDAQDVSFTQAGSGAVATTVQNQLQKTVYVDNYGAVGDWNGVSGTDDRAAIQKAIDANPGKKLIFTPGKRYLLNSYNGRGFAAILNVDASAVFEMNGAELVVGPFFDNKEFIAINCKGPDPSPTPVFDGLTILGGTISFSGVVSQMRTTFILYRVGVHTGQVGNVLIHGVTFKDGDIVNAIKANDGTAPKKRFVRVVDCVFENLVQENTVNTDHSSVYLKAENSHVVDCVFRGATTQNRRVACAVELHGDNSSWVGGSVEGYNKGVFLTALAQEGSTEHLLVSDVVSETTNAFAWIWSEAGVYLRDVLIADCNIRCRHIAGEGAPYNQYQGLLTTEAFTVDATTADGITCRGNRVEIISTTVTGRDTAVYMHLNHAGIVIDNNEFYACHEGIKTNMVSADKTIYRWTITNNKFIGMGDVYNEYVNFGSSDVQGLTFTGNQIRCNNWYNTTGGTRFLKVGGSASTSVVSVKPLDILGATPYWAVEMNVANNKIENVLYSASLSYPSIPGTSTGLVTVSHPALTGMYASASNYDLEAMSAGYPSGVDLHRCISMSGGTPILLAYNHQVAASGAASHSAKIAVRTL